MNAVLQGVQDYEPCLRFLSEPYKTPLGCDVADTVSQPGPEPPVGQPPTNGGINCVADPFALVCVVIGERVGTPSRPTVVATRST